MKKILFILILFPVTLFSQVTISRVALTGTFVGNGSLVTSQSYNKDAGKLYIVIVGISNTGSTPATASLSGTDQTWTEMGSAGGILNGSSFRRIQIFRYAPSSLNTNAYTISYTGSANGSFVEAYVVTGVDVGGTNGSNAIHQVTFSSANSADPTLTFSSFPNAKSVIAGFINSVNPFTGTAESGWTEGTDNGYALPDTGGYIMYRTNTSDNTPTVTAASGNWAGITVAFNSPRRIINIR